MDNLLDEKTKLLYEGSVAQSNASAFAQIANGLVNYSIFKSNKALANTEASQIELNAQERANALREQFNSAVGDILTSVASRGGKVSSGNTRSNIENSSIDLGKDIQKLSTNANTKANLKRMEASAYGRQANLSLLTGIIKAGGAVQKGNIYRNALKTNTKIDEDKNGRSTLQRKRDN